MSFKNILSTIKGKLGVAEGEAIPAQPAMAPAPQRTAPPPPMPPAAAPEPPKKYLYAGNAPGAPGKTIQRNNNGLHPALARVQQQDGQAAAQHAETAARIETMFGEFGTAVCSYMLTQTMTPGGIGRVLKKLSIPSRGRDSADMAQIENWILKEGAEAFCTLAGIRQGGASQLPPPRMPQPDEDDSDAHPPLPPKQPHTFVAPKQHQAVREVGIGRGAERIVRPTSSDDGPQIRSHINQVDVEPIGLQGKGLISRREMKYGPTEVPSAPQAYSTPLPPEAPPADTASPEARAVRPSAAPVDLLRPMVKLNAGEGKRLRHAPVTPPLPEEESAPAAATARELAQAADTNPTPLPPKNADDKPASFYPRRLR